MGVGVAVGAVVGVLLMVADWATASAANCSGRNFMAIHCD